VTETAQGSVSVNAADTGSVTTSLSEDFSVSVVSRPTGKILVDGDIPTTYVKSLVVGSGPLSVSIDAANDATITHLGPGSTGLAYQVYPTSILVDSTGHVRSVVGESNVANYRAGIGLTDTATTSKSDVLTVDNTSSFGRGFANKPDAASARSDLGLGGAALSSASDFAAASHNQSADTITSGTLPVERLPQMPLTNVTTGALTFDLIPDNDLDHNIGSASKQISDVYAGYVHSKFVGSSRVLVRNTSGGTISAGTALCVTGVSSGYPAVGKADASDPAAIPCRGIAAESASAGTLLYMAVSGQIDLDLDAFALGKELYLSSTPGVMTSSLASVSGMHVQCVGFVLKSGDTGVFSIGALSQSFSTYDPAQLIDGGTHDSTMVSMDSMFNSGSIFNGGIA
jgi:hypothetical protein